MKNRILCVIAAVCVLSLAGLLALSVRAEQKQYQNTSVVMPDGDGFPAFDLDEINKICTNGFDVTYELKSRVTAETLNSRQPVTLTGTNSSYAEVMGLQLAAGSFFTESEWTMGNRYAVLNEAAAIRLFGSNHIIGNTVKLDGEVYMVTGIVSDGKKKEDMRAYVPSSVITGQPEALMAKTEQGVGEVRNSLRSLGVYESNGRVIDVASVAGVFWQQFCVAVLVGVSTLLLLLSGRVLTGVRRNIDLLKQRYQRMYLEEVAAASGRELKQISGEIFLVGCFTTALLLIAGKILGTALMWKDIWEEIRYLSDSFFQDKMQWLMRFLVSGPVLFLVFIIGLYVFLVVFFLHMMDVKQK